MPYLNEIQAISVVCGDRQTAGRATKPHKRRAKTDVICGKERQPGPGFHTLTLLEVELRQASRDLGDTLDAGMGLYDSRLACKSAPAQISLFKDDAVLSLIQCDGSSTPFERIVAQLNEVHDRDVARATVPNVLKDLDERGRVSNVDGVWARNG